MSDTPPTVKEILLREMKARKAWQEIAAALAWAQAGEPHTEAEQVALDRYDAAVIVEQYDLDAS